MKKHLLPVFIIFSLLAISCSDNKSEDSKNAPSTEAISAENQKANAFFDRVFDADVDRDPVRQSIFGIKKDYGKWTDISDANAQKELQITKANLDSLHKNI